MKIHSVALLSLALLAGCAAVGPDYLSPDVTASDNWYTSDTSKGMVDAAQPVQPDWWRALQDPQLTELMGKAAIHNLDVRIADAGIREARALRRGAAAGQYPSVEVSASGQRRGLSENSYPPLMPGSDREYTLYQAGFDASWEVDFWGRVRRSVEAADARQAAMQEQRRDVLLVVLAEVARNYAELRGTQQRQAILKHNVSLQAKTVEIVRQRYKSGDASEFELTRMEAQLRSTEAALPNVTADMRASAHRLAVLTGQEPQALLGDLLARKPMPSAPDIVPTGLRSELLRRRPDVRYAERQLAAETATIGVATADLFPRFFLTGSVGPQAVHFSDVFQGTSLAYARGPSIQWPLFRGGEIRARIRAQEARTEAAALRYEKAVLSALEDAETALVRYGEECETRKRLQKSSAAAGKAVRLAQQRYQAGEDNILIVVDAERELLQAEDALVQSQTRVITHLIGLHTALGGGWEVFEKK